MLSFIYCILYLFNIEKKLLNQLINYNSTNFDIYINKLEELKKKLINNNNNNYDNKEKNKTNNLKYNSNTKLYYDLLNISNDSYDREGKKYNNKLFINSDSENNDNKEIENNNNNFKRKDKRVLTTEARNINKVNKNQLNNYYKNENEFIRKAKRGHTIEGMNLIGEHDFSTLEDNYKGIIRYKKAKIKKFKSNRDNLELEAFPYTRRKKGSIYERAKHKKNTVNVENNKRNNNYSIGKKEVSNGNLKYVNKYVGSLGW